MLDDWVKEFSASLLPHEDRKINMLVDIKTNLNFIAEMYSKNCGIVMLFSPGFGLVGCVTINVTEKWSGLLL